jgi:hypothetical protein
VAAGLVCESGTARSCMCPAKDTFNNKILQALISTMVVIQDINKKNEDRAVCPDNRGHTRSIRSGCWNSTQSLGESKRTLSSSAPRMESSKISLIRKSNWATDMAFL